MKEITNIFFRIALFSTLGYAAFGCNSRQELSNAFGEGETDADADKDTNADADADADADTDPANDGEEVVEVFGPDGEPFDVTNPTDGPVSDNVGVNDDGSLVVDHTNASGKNLIWVSNTETNMVSKIDTTSMIELARYRVGAPDPSRTSVGADGNAYVASRKGAGITKISSMGALCPDTNGDGVITTSTGPDNVLDWGQDDCVLWFTDLNP